MLVKVDREYSDELLRDISVLLSKTVTATRAGVEDSTVVVYITNGSDEDIRTLIASNIQAEKWRPFPEQ